MLAAAHGRAAPLPGERVLWFTARDPSFVGVGAGGGGVRAAAAVGTGGRPARSLRRVAQAGCLGGRCLGCER